MLYAAVWALLPACAPQVAPSTMMAIVGAESGYNELSIHDNSSGAHDIHVSSPVEAAEVARGLILAGHSIDLGLGQINSANLGRLGLSVEAVFDPCVNLGATSTVLRAAYADAAATVGEGRAALRMAFSAYNSGNWGTGFTNGYVGRVEARVGPGVPAIAAGGMEPSGPASASPPAVPPHPEWDVFGDLTPAAVPVVRPIQSGASPVAMEPLPPVPGAPGPGRNTPPIQTSGPALQDNGPVSLVRDGTRRFVVR